MGSATRPRAIESHTQRLQSTGGLACGDHLYVECIDKLSGPVVSAGGSCRNSILFFPPGAVVPADVPVPDDLAGELYFGLFKEIYPTLRKALIGYAMPALRREWGAFHPLLVPDGPLDLDLGGAVPDVDLLPETTSSFNKIFEILYHASQMILGTLLERCSAARRRIADDVVLLDALAWALVLGPSVTPFFFRGLDPNSLDPTEIKARLEYAVSPLRTVLLSHPKGYKQHVQSIVDSSRPSAFALVERYFFVAYDRYRLENWLLLMAICLARPLKSWLNRCSLIWAYSWCRSAILRGSRIFLRKSVTDSRWSGLGSPGTLWRPIMLSWIPAKLMRCSRCLCARYCSRDCQTEAWKTGRGYGFEEEVELAIVPHKLVCFDAKIDDVRILVLRK